MAPHASASSAFRPAYFQQPRDRPNRSVEITHRARRSSRSVSAGGSFAGGGFVHPAQPPAVVWQPSKIEARAITIQPVHFIVDSLPRLMGPDIRFQPPYVLGTRAVALADQVGRRKHQRRTRQRACADLHRV